jgi:hypothetical protein
MDRVVANEVIGSNFAAAFPGRAGVDLVAFVVLPQRINYLYKQNPTNIHNLWHTTSEFEKMPHPKSAQKIENPNVSECSTGSIHPPDCCSIVARLQTARRRSDPHNPAAFPDLQSNQTEKNTKNPFRMCGCRRGVCSRPLPSRWVGAPAMWIQMRKMGDHEGHVQTTTTEIESRHRVGFGARTRSWPSSA